MRKPEQVGSTEKVLGIVVLLLLAGIIAAYVVQAETNREYLFNADEAGRPERADAHEIAVAERLLPALGGGGWRAMDVEAYSGAALAAALGDDSADFVAYGARCVYRRRYEATGRAGGAFVALVCDAATPAQAFGLMRARQPAEARPMIVGRGGWQTPSRAGFWNGRYYTELRSAPLWPDKSMIPSQAAREIVAVQLGYGGPFRAEGMLPPVGRVAGSLRYVHRNALGLDALDEVFLVDLAGGMTAWVLEAGSPARAEGVVEDLRKAAKSAESTGAGGGAYPVGEADAEDAGQVERGAGSRVTPRQEGPLTVLPFGESVMAVFATGRHVLGACGKNLDGVVATAMSARMRAASAGSAAVGDVSLIERGSGRPEGESPLPEPGADGWRSPRSVSRFTPDDLYRKINGRAALYIQFNVVGLTFGTYYHQADQDRTIDVYWYDMGEPQNALGIYKAEAPGDTAPVSIGREAYQAGGAVFFLKGSSYVQVLPSGPGEADAGATLEIARRIGENIDDIVELPWALAVLPQEDRVADSFEYIARDAFDLDFLTDVFAAEYDLDGGRIKLFIHRAEDEASAGALFDRYVASFEEYGEVIWTPGDGSRRIAAGKVAGVIDVVFARGRYLGGAAGAEDLDAAKRAASAFFEGLTEP